MTADLPPEAITAAAEAIRAEMRASREVEPDKLARVALEAAAPHIAAAERERIRALAVKHWAICQVRDAVNPSRLFADLLTEGEHHPEPPEVIPVRPKVSRRRG